MSEAPIPVEQNLGKVNLLREDGRPSDVGTLTAYPDHLVFAGKRDTITFSDVRGVTTEQFHVPGGFQSMTRIRLTHGTGGAVATSYVSPAVVGLPKKLREANGHLYDSLRDTYGETHLSGAEEQRIASLDESAREAKVVRARRNMWVGAAVFLGGTLVTTITYAAAQGGGTYWVAYGAILAGLGFFLSGLVDYRRNLGQPGRGPGGAGRSAVQGASSSDDPRRSPRS